MEESERGVIGIYVQCMGVLLYTHRHGGLEGDMLLKHFSVSSSES